ncbi:hypothetical protein RB597_000021 [Gaeumannomyces tritici]
MTRLFASLGLALVCLSAAANAANNIFAAFNGNCGKCLDQAYLSCPGDYMTLGFATCMCAGKGGANVNTCLSYCDMSLNEPTNVVNALYMYCAIFFAKDVCPAAAQVFSQSTMDRLCSPDAVAKSEAFLNSLGGSGSGAGTGSGSGAGSGTGAGTGTGTGSGSGSGSGSGASVPGVAGDSTGNAGGAKATGAGANVGATSTSKALAATAMPLSGLGVMAGLGMALVNVGL